MNASSNRFAFISFYFVIGFLFLLSFFFSGGIFTIISDSSMFVFGVELFSVLCMMPLIFYFHIKNEIPASKKHVLKYFAAFLFGGFCVMMGLAYVMAIVLFQRPWVFVYFIISMVVKYYMLNQKHSTKLLNKEARFFFNTLAAFAFSGFIIVMVVEGGFALMDDVFILWVSLYFLSYPVVDFLSKIFFPKDILIWKKRSRF